ncbi:LptF/LptG family permease [candidate division KSB1 bacterium]
MRIIDRYILKRFLTILIFAVFTFTVIYIITNLIEKLDSFIDMQVPAKMIVLYYIYFIPEIIKEVLPVSMLMASLFAISQLVRNRELIALKSTGMSLYRILSSIIIFSFLLSVFSFFFNELFVPYFNQLKFDVDRQYLMKLPPKGLKERSNITIQDSTNQILNIGYFDGEKLTAYNISALSQKDNAVTHRIDAKQMKRIDSSWVLINGVERKFSETGEELKAFKEMDNPSIHVKPEDLSVIQIKPGEMNYAELEKFIKKLSYLGSDTAKWSTHLYQKFAFPFSNFIIVLFGIAFASAGWKGGAAKGFSISLIICFFYYGINVSLGPILGEKGMLPPELAAWLGNIIFGVLAVISLKHSPK